MMVGIRGGRNENETTLQYCHYPIQIKMSKPFYVCSVYRVCYNLSFPGPYRKLQLALQAMK